MKWPRLHYPKERRWRVALWSGVALVVVMLLWALLAWLLRPKDKGPPPTPVTVALAAPGDVDIILRGLGQVQAYNTYTAKSRVDGNITAVAYQEGGHVHAGDLLVQIDPRPYQAALAQAKAVAARDEAQLANARLDLDRYKQLLPQGLTTKQTYDTQVATVKQLAATEQSDRAQIQSALLNLDYTSIRAPFDGRAGQRLVDIGNLVHSTDQTSLVVLTQTRPIFVSFTLPELNLGEIVKAMHGDSVQVRAFDSNDNNEIATGTLTVLDNTVDPGTGTVRLKAQFANRDESLWPGEFVNAHVVVAIRKHGFTIPSSAVQMGPNGRFVFRVSPQNKVQVVPVTVEQIEQSKALVVRGLHAKDRVVVDGAFGLSAGDAVSVSGIAKLPPSTGLLDMTGRTADTNPAMTGTARPDTNPSQPPQAPTARQPPQPQTAPAGRRLDGSEGPAARAPLSDQRQTATPPSSTGSNDNSQGAGSSP